MSLAFYWQNQRLHWHNGINLTNSIDWIIMLLLYTPNSACKLQLQFCLLNVSTWILLRLSSISGVRTIFATALVWLVVGVKSGWYQVFIWARVYCNVLRRFLSNLDCYLRNYVESTLFCSICKCKRHVATHFESCVFGNFWKFANGDQSIFMKW